MMDYTDRFYRYFIRLISKHTLLYTEMVTTGALIYGDKKRFLAFDPVEQPVALQLGGNDPQELATCAQFAETAGFNEVNLNCGCPSDRVKNGNFGASLMKTPALVSEIVSAMADNTSLPVTVKNRIGVDDFDSYDYLRDFVGTVSDSGCRTFIIHARKAWLNGLSPKQNREIPPLQYPLVYRLKKDFPSLEIIINGGITTLKEAEQHLKYVDGVMFGREAYHNPYFLADVDQHFFNDQKTPLTRQQVLEAFTEYTAAQVDTGIRLNHITRHILGLYSAQPGARKFRRFISENSYQHPHNAKLLIDAAGLMSAFEAR